MRPDTSAKSPWGPATGAKHLAETAIECRQPMLHAVNIFADNSHLRLNRFQDFIHRFWSDRGHKLNCSHAVVNKKLHGLCYPRRQLWKVAAWAFLNVPVIGAGIDIPEQIQGGLCFLRQFTGGPLINVESKIA